jgi:Fe-S cluster biogenesis protein NfuA
MILEELMFIQTEATPNPATLKFLPGGPVLENGSREIQNEEEARISPLASALFTIDGVSGVFLGPDFISVTKSSGEWPHLKPAILGAIMEHFMSGGPMLTPGADGGHQDAHEFFAPEDSEIVVTIKDLIETRVRPAVAADGGDIVFRGFKDGVVYLQMKGACSGCPSSTATLKRGIQNLLCHFLPEVKSVEQA